MRIMVNSVTLYRLETTEDYETIYSNVSAIDDTYTTPNGTALRKWVRNANEIGNMMFLATFHYHEEIYAPISDSDNYVAIEDALTIGFIGPQNLIVFGKKKLADKIANMLNFLLYSDELIIFNNSFSEEFMLRFIRGNPHQTGLAFMRDLSIPNASHQGIYGGNVENSEVYKQALAYQ